MLTVTGITAMMLLTATKVEPSQTAAGYAVFVGIAFFFLTEAAAKARGAESGLRFHTISEDVRKPGVMILMLLPMVSAIATLVAGNPGIVAYDIATIFVDSLIFSVVYHRSGNCVVSTFSHILGNGTALAAVFVLF